MSRAIANRELRLHYQPIVKLQTDALVGYEALVRWQHPRRGLLAPCEFLPAAQRSEIGADIDSWVLLEACRQASHWAQTGHSTTICVNVVPGFGATAGTALVEHPDVDKVTFTGSPAVGRQILRGAAGNLKRVTLELGGKSANIVFPDADLDGAARAAGSGIFFNSGQVCSAGSRILG